MLSLEDRRKKFNIPNNPTLAQNKTLALNIIAPDRQASVVRGYIRVSTLKQKIAGQSLDAQQEQITNYCRSNQLPDPVFYKDEAVSGRATKRVFFDRMCNDLKIGDIIITYSMSRLGRNMDKIRAFLTDMKSRYIKVICLKENINFEGTYGNLILTLLTSIAEVESNLCRERTADAMRRLKENGTLRTKPKFGYRYQGTGKDRIIIEEPNEQKVINFILAIITGNPNISDAEITRLVNDEITVGNLTYKDNPKIYQSSVRNIILNNNLRSDTIDHITRRVNILEAINENSKDELVSID